MRQAGKFRKIRIEELLRAWTLGCLLPFLVEVGHKKIGRASDCEKPETRSPFAERHSHLSLATMADALDQKHDGPF